MTSANAAVFDNEILDAIILKHLATQDVHPHDNPTMLQIVDGDWRRIDARIQALRKAGRVRFHRAPISNVPPHVKAHRWEVVW